MSVMQNYCKIILIGMIMLIHRRYLNAEKFLTSRIFKENM
jgi:hypothetical protein